MAGNFDDGFGVVVIHFVHAGLFGIFRFGSDAALLLGQLADAASVVGIVGDDLGDDVGGTGQGGVGVGHFLGFVHIGGGQISQRTGGLLLEDQHGQGLQTALLGDDGAGASFGSEGAVQVLHFHHGFGVLDLGHQLGGHFFLLGNGTDDLLLFGLQIA